MSTPPISAPQDAGVPVHVWVDETRPRNQGASLTAWELAEHGVPHTIIADNVGGHLMQHGMVDLCLVDRIIVGEVRGEEALDMLQAMNTGHDGSLTTIHANTPRDAL